MGVSLGGRGVARSNSDAWAWAVPSGSKSELGAEMSSEADEQPEKKWEINTRIMNLISLGL